VKVAQTTMLADGSRLIWVNASNNPRGRQILRRIAPQREYEVSHVDSRGTTFRVAPKGGRL